MKKHFVVLFSTCLFTLISGTGILAQNSTLKKKLVETKASTSSSKEAENLEIPKNNKAAPLPKPKTRGDVYGPNYSDIIIDNWTGYSVDIYIDNHYRASVSAWGKITTWAVPGTTKLYGVARFTDGTTMTWGPQYRETGYEYTWRLTSN